jgi:uncharacterized delta-60 repeat protein
MEKLIAFVATCLIATSSAFAGTGKQSYNIPISLPSGSTLAGGFVEAVGSGAAVATTFTVPPTPAKRYAGIYHVNPDGTLDTTMAPEGVTIHTNETMMVAFDFAFDKLALAGLWGPLDGSPQHSWLQTYSAFEPGEDPPVIDLAGAGRYLSIDHDTANDRFVLMEGISNNPTIVVTDSSGALDTSFNGTGILDTGLISNITVARFAPDGSIIVAIGQHSYFTGMILHLRRYSATGTLLTSTSQNIGFASLGGMVIDSSGRPIIGSLLAGFGGRFAMVFRYTSNLLPDSTFGIGGKATFSFLANPGQTSCYNCAGGSVALQEDEKIVYGGYRENYASLAVARINTDGTLDTSFGNSGAQYINITGATFHDGGAVAMDDADGIWVTGRTYQSGLTNTKIILGRLTADGQLDTTFGSTP